ncbi:Cas10/Cmr2 second palm domain-containing protein [Actinomadura napierensis]|uniref:Cas10/Cmr2 second palm domain-containing protein n=1 Tax=Actinomadura napierensis TaxID=267854 RepID=A0ABN3ADI4_9ACTN
MKVHAVVIGTFGNQRYIFSSNKRRENVGASYLITRVEDAWLDEALMEVVGSADRHRSIEGHPVEVVTANAGGVTALVRDREVGRRLVTAITLRALREASGLDVCGVVGDPVEWADAGGLAEGIGRTRELLSRVAMTRPGPQLRFAGVPVAARCGSSGLPAQKPVVLAEGANPEPRSAPSMAKLDAFEDALGRLAVKMGLAATEKDKAVRAGLREAVDHLAERADWVAVVHADGNGLGKVFQNFTRIIGSEATARSYVDSLRGLSTGVDDCAVKAVRITLDKLKRTIRQDGKPAFPLVEKRNDQSAKEQLPLLPLVLGGDDLTVVCDGAMALSFAERYLRAFADCAKADPRVGDLLREAGQPELGACAGVAIVKRHYPFHSAAELAEGLTKEAKSVKKQLGPNRCALSFHALYESAFANLARLRTETTLPDGTRLTAQPYVVGEAGEDPGGWSRHRHWDDLCARVQELTRTNEEGEQVLAAGQAHDLRAGLFLGKDVADARFSMLTMRMGNQPAAKTLGDGDSSLFWSHDGEHRTGLLDAMDAVGFLPTDARIADDEEARA